MTSDKRLFSSIRYNFSAEALLILTSFVFTPMLILSLGVKRYGILVLAQTVVGLATMVDFGLRDIVVRYGSQAMDKANIPMLKQVFTYTLAAGLITSILATVATFLSGPWLVTTVFHIDSNLMDEALQVFTVVPALVLVTYLGFFPVSYLQAAERFDLINFKHLVQGLVGTAGYVILVKFGYNLAVLTLVATAVQLVLNGGLLIFVYLRNYLVVGLEYRPETVRQFAWYAFQRQANNLLVVTSNQLPKLILGIFASTAAVSFFAVPWQIMERLSSITLLVTSALYPHLSRLASTAKHQVAYIYHLVFTHISMLLVPGFTILALNANRFLSLWISPEFAQQSSGILAILCVAGIFRSLISIPGVTLASLDRPDINTKYSAFYIVWLLTAGIILTHFLADLGISAIVTLGKLVQLAFYVYFANSISNLSAPRKLDKSSTIGLSVLFAVLIALPLNLFFNPERFFYLVLLMGGEYLLVAVLFIKIHLLDISKLFKLIGLRALGGLINEIPR